MLENMTLTVEDLWKDIEPVMFSLRQESWVDPVLKDKFEAIANNYDGNVESGTTTAILGKVESITTMLSMESYYRTRNTSDKEKRILLDLNENLLLLKQVLNSQRRDEEKEEMTANDKFIAGLKEAGENRLPNLDTDREQSLMGDGKNKKVITR